MEDVDYDDRDARFDEVGALPFTLGNIAAADNRRTVFGRSKLAWDHVVEIASRWGHPDWPGFLLSEPHTQDETLAEWIPRWPLGKGGYGKVALWAKYNEYGKIEDQVVIKQQQDPSPAEMYGAELLREAVFYGHLTAMKASKAVIPQLRRYKFPPDENHTAGDVTRLYLRYAPNGNLEDLFDRYRARNMYLPELYLWSMFRDLAKANLLLKKCPSSWNPIPREPHTEDPVDKEFDKDIDSFICHQDIKRLNCFIAPEPVDPARRYLSPYP